MGRGGEFRVYQKIKSVSYNFVEEICTGGTYFKTSTVVIFFLWVLKIVIRFLFDWSSVRLETLPVESKIYKNLGDKYSLFSFTFSKKVSPSYINMKHEEDFQTEK